MKSDTVITVAAIGIGAYALYQAIQGLSNVKDKLASVGEAIGSGLFTLFHPDPVGETLFYTVTFPASPIGDGQRHAVPSRSIDMNGRFILQEFFGLKRWQLLTGKDGKRYAAPL